MRPIRRDPVEALTQIDDHPAPDCSARHPAPRPTGHERSAGVRRPADQPPQLLHAAGQRHPCGHHAVDPRTFGVRGPDARVGAEAGEGASGKAHGAHGGKYMRALSLTRLHPRVMLEPQMPADAPRAQLIHIETDRRLGHEWDEWDGRPLPGNGDFSAPPGLFFRFAALTIGIGMALGAALIFLLGPRLVTLWPLLPRTLWLALGAAATATWLWFGTLVFSFYAGVLALPEGWLERGPYLRLMSLTSHVSRAFGKRDWEEHAAIDVYNTLAERRGRTVGPGELLFLIPRCLSKQALDGVLAIAGRYEVPVFVATRGQLARRVIRERRPRAVVAVACERDMMTGLRDVAGRLPVLGLTMRLPNGPCRDAMLDLDVMEQWVKSLVGA